MLYILYSDNYYRSLSMCRREKFLLFIAVLLLGMRPLVVQAYSYNLSAASIYYQAQQHNEEYFQLLKRYAHAIDLTDNNGNTAYCLALQARDGQTMNYLAQHGANVRHSCVARVVSKRDEQMQKKYPEKQQVRSRYKNRGFFDDDKNIWYTAGAVALIGGGVAAIVAGSGGGGGGSGKKQDSGGGSKKNDAPYVYDDVEPAVPSGELHDMSASQFKTKEYKKGNFLDAIRAAEAYSVIYKQDDKGKVFGKQADSDEDLAKIKVGVLDTGTYVHNDLKGTLKKGYDLNQYNRDASIWGYIDSEGNETYVYKKGSLYYYARFHHGEDNTVYLETYPEGTRPQGVSKEQVEAYVKNVSGVNFKDMTLMNGGGYGTPGKDMSSFMTKDPGDGSWMSNWYELATEVSHGTHVAGIIGANKDDKGMHGIAFDNAEIYAMSWDMDQKISSTIKSAVSDGVQVFNHSWGTSVIEGVVDADQTESLLNQGLLDDTYIDVFKSYAYAAKNKAVWVQATGNDGKHNATLENGLGKIDMSKYGYEGAGEHEVPYVAVTALDMATADNTAPSGKIASYANWCGSASGYCIAAPGTDVKSTIAVQDSVLSMDGTSMATPVVSGSIALVNGYYPWLSAQNVAWLLLETANNTGEYSNSQKYGRGALDLEAAVKTPIGELSLADGKDFSSLRAAKSNRIALSGIMQKQMEKAMPSTVTAFDELHRPFAYDTSKLMTKTHGSNANFRNEVSRAAIAGPKKVVKDEEKGFQFTQREMLNKGGQANLSSIEVLQQTEEGSTRFYYSEDSKYATGEDVTQPVANPYFAMKEAYGAENMMKLSDNSRLKLSLQTGENGLYDRDYEQDRQGFDERSYAVGAEYSFNLTDYLELAAVGGMLYEEDAMLGMNGRGGFAIRDGSTYYMGLKAALNLTPNMRLMAAYYRGYTQGQDAAMLSISDLETESYMLAGEYQINGQNKVGLSLATPLTVRKGKASFAYASGRDNYSDTIYMNKLTSSLKPAVQEYDLGMYYQGVSEKDLNILGKLEARFNADGEKGLTDYIGIVGLSKSF